MKILRKLHWKSFFKRLNENSWTEAQFRGRELAKQVQGPQSNHRYREERREGRRERKGNSIAQASKIISINAKRCFYYQGTI